jgi:hypothetical protein
MPQLVLEDLVPRLRAAGVAVRSAHAAHELELELRDALVVAAVDHGVSQRTVAGAAGVSLSRVCAILGASQPLDE